jgi:hypothetical protein
METDRAGTTHRRPVARVGSLTVKPLAPIREERREAQVSHNDQG